jgi:hypothetical protein
VSSTAATGVIAHRWGPSIGGLFLAFPAILPASATLVEKREKQKKKRVGLQGITRGREAAALDAAGALLGCIGLADFALVTWLPMTAYYPWAVLVGASLLWLNLSALCWKFRNSENALEHLRSDCFNFTA